MSVDEETWNELFLFILQLEDTATLLTPIPTQQTEQMTHILL